MTLYNHSAFEAFEAKLTYVELRQTANKYIYKHTDKCMQMGNENSQCKSNMYVESAWYRQLTC